MTQKSILSLNRRLFSWSMEEIRHGQLWPISIALTLIIACVFALSALAERMEQVIVKQGKDALTADLVYASSNPVPDTLFDSIRAQPEVSESQLVRFSTMAFSENEMQLVTVKAVDSTYPLRGNLILNNGSSQLHQVSAGELWLDERVFSLLDIKEGDTVTLGDADFVVNGKVVQEPGLSFNPFQQMPAVYIHSSDIEKTGALRLGSRVRFNLYLTGNEQSLTQIKDSVTLTPSDRWRDQSNGSRSNEMFERTTQYLSLTVAIVIIMAATTLVLTCQNYVAGRRKTIAMLKSLGASKSWLRHWLLIQVVILFVIGTVFGIFSGYLLEILLRIPLTDLLPDPLPSYGIKPYLVAMVSCVLIGIPALGIPLLGLINTSAANVMQAQGDKKSWTAYLLVLVPIIPMIIAYHNNTLVWIVLAGIVLLFALLGVLSLLIIKLINKLPISASMKLAVSRINRSGLASTLQFGALGLSLMLLAVIWLVRTDLLQDWQQAIPDNAPNVFSINIAPYEIEDYLKVLDSESLERSKAYPIIRGRISEINDVAAKDYQGVKPDAESLSRELNFTWVDDTWANDADNQATIIEGEWTPSAGVSVESEVAADLNIHIGDQMSFVINSKKVNATVNSIRHVEWREMKPNFYFIFSEDVLESLPATWMVSYKVDNNDNQLLSDLSRNFPTVSLLDIRAMGEKIRGLLTQLIWSITVLASLGVVAGLLLIFTLLRLSLSQRQDEIRLYRTLGASKRRIKSTIWSEYGLMAVVAGLVASLGAEVSVVSIMKVGFELEGRAHPVLWVALPVLSFIVLAIVIRTLIKQLLLPIKSAQ
ncbi:FtsX-like permease family protein [Vibrio sp. TH_r3]|uniref:ABC transporter permease n=1 Tax=Vibrio sp. TH_r3 TaxID=3082084 RepID=UPI0029544C38|nr:FtsX-like permease family protein [Vibrio sp. TH_r3]MDV7103525.1 FtsX-like permease family protein [Vibrio sp. TH_r3]